MSNEEVVPREVDWVSIAEDVEGGRDLASNHIWPIEFLRNISLSTHPRLYSILEESPAREIRRRISKPSSIIRFCTGVTKHGQKCGSVCPKDSLYCNYHNGMIGHGSNARRPHKRRKLASEAMREIAIEEFMDDLISPGFEALHAVKTRHILVGDEVRTFEEPDHITRLKAQSQIINIIEGKPGQTITVNKTTMDSMYADPTDITDADIVEDEDDE